MMQFKEKQDSFSQAITSLISDAVETVLTNLVKEGKVKLPAQSERTEDKPDELLTIDQFCAFVHVSKPTFHSLVHRGVLNPRKCGHRTLISRAEVMEKLETGVLGRYKRTTNKE